MSEPRKPMTVPELVKELGLNPTVADTSSATEDRIRAALTGVGGAFARPSYVQGSVADHMRMPRTADPGAQILAAVRDAIEAKGVHIARPDELRIALMTHDEILLETPSENVIVSHGDYMDTELKTTSSATWAEATPGQILEDINALAANIRQAAKPMNFGNPMIPIVPMAFEQLPPQPPTEILTTMHARAGGVVSFRSGAVAGHWHRHTPLMATINCRCYADYRVTVGRAENETGHYDIGERIDRAPSRMPRLKIAGRPIDPRALGWLAIVYGPHAGCAFWNRHTARRWLKRFRVLLDIASDALEQSGWQDRRAAIEVLTKMIGVQEAIDLTTPNVEMRSRWTGSLDDSNVRSYHQLVGRLHRGPRPPGEWFMSPDVGVPYQTQGTMTIPLVPGSTPPAPGSTVYVTESGQYTFAAPENVSSPVGTFVGPGATPGTMLVQLTNGLPFVERPANRVASRARTYPERGTSLRRGVPLAYAADDAANTLELAMATQGLMPGDGPYRFSSADGELPEGIDPDADYYVGAVTDEPVE